MSELLLVDPVLNDNGDVFGPFDSYRVTFVLKMDVKQFWCDLPMQVVHRIMSRETPFVSKLRSAPRQYESRFACSVYQAHVLFFSQIIFGGSPFAGRPPPIPLIGSLRPLRER